MTKQCARPRCTAPAMRVLCKNHQAKVTRVRREHGEFDPVDTAAAREHLHALHRLGHSWKELRRLVPLRDARTYALRDGALATLPRHTVDAILAIPLTVRPDPRPTVSAIGAVRRVAALNWQGWSHHYIAAKTGVSRSTLSQLGKSQRITAEHARCIAEFYATHEGLVGPSAHARGLARAAGALPPGVWDPETIDDPDARPDLSVLRDGLRRPRRVAPVNRIITLRERGQSWEEIGAVLGFSAATVKNRFYEGRVRRRAAAGQSAVEQSAAGPASSGEHDAA